MQYRSGHNPHEPTNPDHRSRVWKFILRRDHEALDPLAFLPHCTQVAWIFTPYPRSPTWGMLRGIVRFSPNPRNYHTLKTRYSKNAEWIPVSLNATDTIAEYTTRSLPHGSTRYVYWNENPQPLQVVGLGIEVADLIESYLEARVAAKIEESWTNSGYEVYRLPPNYVSPPPSPPRQPLNEEVWIELSNGSRLFLARWVNDELLFDPPP